MSLWRTKTPILPSGKERKPTSLSEAAPHERNRPDPTAHHSARAATMATHVTPPLLAGSISVQALEAALAEEIAEGLAMELAATLALALARAKLCLSITVPPGVCAVLVGSHGRPHCCARRPAHPFAAPSSGPAPEPPG
jgi:hypothetical protein